MCFIEASVRFQCKHSGAAVCLRIHIQYYYCHKFVFIEYKNLDYVLMVFSHRMCTNLGLRKVAVDRLWGGSP